MCKNSFKFLVLLQQLCIRKQNRREKILKRRKEDERLDVVCATVSQSNLDLWEETRITTETKELEPFFIVSGRFEACGQNMNLLWVSVEGNIQNSDSVGGSVSRDNKITWLIKLNQLN